MPHASTAQIVEATGLSKHYVNMAKANPEGTSSFTTGKRHRKQRSDAYTWNCPEIEQLIAFFLTVEKTRCSPNRKDVWIDQSVSPERAYPVMLYWMKIEDLWLAYREWKARLTSIFAAQNDFFPRHQAWKWWRRRGRRRERRRVCTDEEGGEEIVPWGVAEHFQKGNAFIFLFSF